MKKLLINIGLAFIIILLPQFATSAIACTCRPIPSPYRAFQEAKAVFVGKVVSTKDVPYQEQLRDKSYTVQDRHFLFKVEEAFKGIKSSEVDISAGRIDSSCYSGFTVGESYLVYAYGETGKTLETHMCSRTNHKAYAHADIYYIRALLKGLPEPRVYGAVIRSENDLTKKQSGLAVPLEGIKVVVEGEGKRFEAVTDSQGLYSLFNIPDGKYKASPVLPDKYMSYWPGEEEFILGSQVQTEGYIPLQQGESAYARFSVGWNNRIRGKILDAEGNTIKRAKVALLLARPSSSPLIIEEDRYDYHEDGKYEFYGLTPNKYFLSLTIRAPFKSKNMVTRFYYPSAINFNQAREIEVGENGTLTDRDIQLPLEYLVRPIEGEVVWSDGSPVEDAWVFLAESARSEDDDKKYDWVSADKQGKFSLQAFVGAEYWIHATVDTWGMKTNSGKDLYDTGVRRLKAQPIKVTVSKVNEHLRLVITLPEGVQKRIK